MNGYLWLWFYLNEQHETTDSLSSKKDIALQDKSPKIMGSNKRAYKHITLSVPNGPLGIQFCIKTFFTQTNHHPTLLLLPVLPFFICTW
ncbi:hypothetical protein Hanom_Chr12g01160961 [Helianthus anomalus]